MSYKYTDFKDNVNYNVLIDYLTVTFAFEENEVISRSNSEEFLKDMMNVLTFGNFISVEFVDKPKGGYTSYYTIGEHIMLMFNGPLNKNGNPTHKLELKGEACREFEDRGGDWWSLLLYLTALGCNFTRIDIAVDDFKGEHCIISSNKEDTRPSLLDYSQRKQFVSPIRTWEYRLGFVTSAANDQPDQKNIEILTYGSSTSNTLIRIYDKKVERLARGHDTWIDFWIRYEMQFRHERAAAMVARIVALENFNDIKKIAAETLLAYLDFKENTGKSRMKNENTVSWWSAFLGDVDKVFLRNQKDIETSVTRKMEWYNNSATKSYLQNLFANKDNFKEQHIKGLEEKFKALSEKDISLFNNDRLKNGLTPLSPEEIKKVFEDHIEYLKKQK